jgi:hypothetical protein
MQVQREPRVAAFLPVFGVPDSSGSERQVTEVRCRPCDRSGLQDLPLHGSVSRELRRVIEWL